MKLLLVNTNRMKPAVAPIGLDYVADVLQAEGHELRLLDLCFSEDVFADIDKALSSFTPDLIGVTIRNTDDCYYSSQVFFLTEIKEILDYLRAGGTQIVLGGVGFSVAPEAVMDFCGIDLGIAGESELSFPLLARALECKTDLCEIPNLCYRVDGRIRRNITQHCDLDRLPLRTRSFIDNARYFHEGGQAGIETKRGCNMACIYCADPVSKGRSMRLRPPAMVVAEFQTLLCQGIDHFHTCDCEFNLPGEHAKEICRAIIDRKIGDRICWYAYCSIKPFDKEMASLFKQAGCAGIDFGADSGCNNILHTLGRHFTVADILDTARICHEQGITFMYDLLVGGPNETRETIRETIDLMRRIEVDCVGVAMGMRVYNGTAMADLVRAQGEMSSNHNLFGATLENPNFLKPVFYITKDLGQGIVSYLHELVSGDKRFFLPSKEQVQSNYNYNDNSILVDAIRDGARGAYWDILRRL